MPELLSIVKIGGKVLDQPDVLNESLRRFANISGPKILVHGGGVKATRLCKALGIETHMVEGRRITSKDCLEVTTMVYAGLLNKQIVAELQGLNCNAIGLSGPDANSIKAVKREEDRINYGWVGDIDSVNTQTIKSLLKMNLYPVFCAISHDQKGQLLNTNADTIASEIAVALQKSFKCRLLLCLEKKGVLINPHDDESVIERLSLSDYVDMKKKGQISSGMIPKVDNAFNAHNKGVYQVLISNYESIGNSADTGTLIID